MEPETVATASGAAALAGDVAGETGGSEDLRKKAEELNLKLTEAQSTIDSLKTDSDRNLRRLQGTLQSQVNSLKAQSEEEKRRWEDAFHQEKMSGMEEKEALRYNNTLLEQRVQERETELARISQQAAEAGAAASYLQQFVALGVPMDKLNAQGTLQDLADSGWEGLRQVREQERSLTTQNDAKLAEFQKQLDLLKAGITDPNKLAELQGDKPAQRLANQTGGEARGAQLTELEAVKAAAQYFGGREPSLEELYRAVETKRLPVTVLPGLQGYTEE